MGWFTTAAIAASPAFLSWEHALHQPGCHREAVEQVNASWPTLTDAERRAVQRRTPLWRSTLPPPPADAPSCVPAQAENQLLTDHFVIEWHEGQTDLTRATAVGEAFETSWNRLFNELGWREPLGSDDWRISVYLTDDSFEGGFTTEVDCAGTPVPTIVIGAGTFNYETWYQDVAAHELHHASHYRYGRAFDNWWWEATATWVQEQVYPNNDEWAYYANFYVANPQWSLTTTSYTGDLARHMYGRALWVFWLEQQLGGHDYVQSLWERSSTLPANQRAEMADVMSPEADFGAQFVAFAHALTVGGVGEGHLYELPAYEEVLSLPASGQLRGANRIRAWGMHYVRFQGAALDRGTLTVTASSDQPTLDVALLGVRDGRIATVVRDVSPLVLDASDTYDEAWLVSVGADNVGFFQLDWAAEGVGDAPEPQPDPNEEAKSGCGCAQTPGRFSLSLFALALVGALARRRR